MNNIQFSIENFEIYLLIVIRVVSMLAIAPIFGMRNVPRMFKLGMCIFISVVLINVVPVPELVYSDFITFGLIIIKEILVGIVIGFSAYAATVIISLAGQLIDQQIGFSMVSVLDPMSQVQLSVTANFYYYVLLLLMLATNIHYFIISALVDSFTLIPIGGAVINPSIYSDFISFVTDYILIGFRISLPIFGSILLLDAVLGILAKTVPQINMFVVGMPLKALCGLLVLLVTVGLMPTISDFIFNEMIDVMQKMINGLSPG
ncbi:MAG: flagellar biosynthetic protein FliR [Clostridiales bacterium]|jgi:flagellar biosynthetic protein FliR|nr:flagellar biosynthetic protein FliR [Clostridiales bacterium]